MRVMYREIKREKKKYLSFCPFARECACLHLSVEPMFGGIQAEGGGANLQLGGVNDVVWMDG